LYQYVRYKSTCVYLSQFPNKQNQKLIIYIQIANEFTSNPTLKPYPKKVVGTFRKCFKAHDPLIIALPIRTALGDSVDYVSKEARLLDPI